MRTRKSVKKIVVLLSMSLTTILLCALVALSQVQSYSKQIDSIQQSCYLPLSVGNKWVYRKIVPPGVKVFAWEAPVIDKKINFVFGPVEAIQSGTFKETFMVKGCIVEEGHQRWLIDVSDETARDGRYGCLYTRVDRIFWGRLVSSEHVIEIGEIMIWDHFAGPYRQERTLLIEPIQKDIEAHISRFAGVTTRNSAKRVTVTVPAGKFTDCLEIVTEVQVPDVEDKVEKVWKTFSYYAPNVGLVKEEQKTADGKPAYVLELVKYELTG